MKTLRYTPVLVLFVLLLAGCATKKTVQPTGSLNATETESAVQSLEDKSLHFVQKVFDNQLYQVNLVSDLTLTANIDGKTISLPGSLHMRRNEVIRLQLFVPFIGTEIGRMEFTPDYVLVVDRLHKEYVKGSYSDVDFLSQNGLSFYSLQALFWNQLSLPGLNKVTENNLKEFKVDFSSSDNNTVGLKQNMMTYEWTADKNTALISAVQIVYESASHGTSSLKCDYGNFSSFGSKRYPCKQVYSLATRTDKTKRKASFTLDMDTPSNDASWTTLSTISEKYKKVEPQDVLGKLLSM